MKINYFLFLIVLLIGYFFGVNYPYKIYQSTLKPLPNSKGIMISNKKAIKYALSLNNPDSVYIKQAKYMRPNDLVIGLIVKGQPKAYPWYVLSRYHVVNDVIVGEPILISFCELCSGASAFFSIVGKTSEYFLGFRSCGLKYGTIEICDVESHSRWHPFLGVALKGFLKGKQLKRIPVYYQSWENWSSKYPNTLVVNGSDVLRTWEHGHGITIGDNHLSPKFKKISNLDDDRLFNHELVFGLLEAQDYPLAIPLKDMKQVFQFEWNNTSYVGFLQSKYHVGIFKRELNGIIRNFKLHSLTPFQLIDSEKNIVNEIGEVISGSLKGKYLQPVEGYLTEWYEWVSFFPESHILKSNL